MTRLGIILLAALVLVAGPSLGETIEENVAGNEVRVIVLEGDETHSSGETDTTSHSYDQEDLSNGIFVNEDGVLVKVTRFSSTFERTAPIQVMSQQDGVVVSTEAGLAGTRSNTNVGLTLFDVRYTFAENDRGEARAALLHVDTVTWGDGFTLGRTLDASGTLALLTTPSWGDVGLVGIALLTGGGAGAGPTVVGDSTALSGTAIGGDANGVRVTASLWTVRCDERTCQVTSESTSECLGYQPPFFLWCPTGL